MKTPQLIILILVTFLFWAKAISDITKTRFKNENSSKIWLLIVFFVPVLGALLYFLLKKRFIKTKPKIFVSKFDDK